MAAEVKNLIIILFFLLVSSCLADSMQFDNIYLEYQRRDEKIAARLGRRLSEDIGNFQKTIGHYPQLKTQIIIAADREEYKSFLHQTGGIQEFSQAIYRRSSNTIYIRNPRDELRFESLNRILLHEYIHSFVNYYFSNAPLWFHEGMAVYFSGDFGHNRELGLVRDYLFGNTKPLWEMREHYPANRLEWESFYSKSALAVRYLYQNKKDQFYRFWEEAMPYRKFNAAFMRSFRYTQEDFSIMFEEYCKTHFRSEIILALSGMIWLVFPILFMIGYMRRRHKTKQKLAEMEAEEQEYWQTYGEVDFEIEIDEEQ
jgi:hypothetical protein